MRGRKQLPNFFGRPEGRYPAQRVKLRPMDYHLTNGKKYLRQLNDELERLGDHLIAAVVLSSQ